MVKILSVDIQKKNRRAIPSLKTKHNMHRHVRKSVLCKVVSNTIEVKSLIDGFYQSIEKLQHLIHLWNSFQVPVGETLHSKNKPVPF